MIHLFCLSCLRDSFQWYWYWLIFHHLFSLIYALIFIILPSIHFGEFCLLFFLSPNAFNLKLCWLLVILFNSAQFSSVTQLCLTVWDSMNHSMPGLPVWHQLPEFNQTHVHRVGDPTSHPLSSLSPLAFNPCQHQGLFPWVNSPHEMAKVLYFQLQHQSFQWTFRTHLL